jgi:hypothetical protein
MITSTDSSGRTMTRVISRNGDPISFGHSGGNTHFRQRVSPFNQFFALIDLMAARNGPS